jgi:branched-chain amino acid transport system permease protein
MEKFAQILISGVAVGGIYAMAALGFVLIFKATRVVNFAQGSLMMLGGYVGFAAVVTWSMPIVLGFVVSAVVVGLVGALIYVLTLRPVVNRGTDTGGFAQVIITMAWTILIVAAIQFIWGAVAQRPPNIFPTGTTEVGGILLAYNDMGTIAITLVVVLAFTLLFRFTRYGLVLRGLADNRQAAVMMGADPRIANAGAWALAAAAAALAGFTLTTYSPLTLTFGDIALMAFPAVVLGGIDSIVGGLIGGILIGIVQQLAAGYIDPGFGQTAGFIVMLVVLLVRPNGILGSPETVRL